MKPVSPSFPAGRSSPTPKGIVETTQPNGVAKTLLLSPGPQEMVYAIEALDPPTHTFSVRLVASGRPDLTVWMDADVTLLVTSGTQRADSCRRLKGRIMCRWDYPALEARKPGTWTVHVLKTTAAPSMARITVLFEPLT